MICPFSQPYELWLLKKNIYGLQLSPNNWFKKLARTIRGMVLLVYPHDLCIYTGTFTTEGPHIYIGFYMDNFVYFSK